MIVVFDKEYLRDLYQTGRSNDKKHRFQPNVVAGYVKAINFLKHSVRKEDLFHIRSLHFEALKGDKAGLYSVRANNQYRVEFTISENMDMPVLTIANIIELSNHYD